MRHADGYWVCVAGRAGGQQVVLLAAQRGQEFFEFIARFFLEKSQFFNTPNFKFLAYPLAMFSVVVQHDRKVAAKMHIAMDIAKMP